MMSLAFLRKGWCPGALRPMQSGDGLIIRVRPRAGKFSIFEMVTIAETAERFGSGEIDLTNRANLQLRGVSDETYANALAALDAAGLIDQEADAEAVRNVVVDPLSGVDPSRADVRGLALDLERSLVQHKCFWSLPGKFGFSFSGSSRRQFGGRPADIMVSVANPDFLAISLDGNCDAHALVCKNDVVDAITRVAAVFLEMRASDPTIGRMRDAVSRRGSVMIYAAAGLASCALPAASCGAICDVHVGLLSNSDRIFAVGVGLPFGRAGATDLAALCEAARRAGAEVVHTSPQRALVFPVDDARRASLLLSEALTLGLITESGDLRRAIDVCPGAPACRNGTTETRRDAQNLVDVLQEALAALPSLHISGCEKGCARRGAAALTLVARDGRYDVICNDCPSGSIALAGVAPPDLPQAVARFIRERTR